MKTDTDQVLYAQQSTKPEWFDHSNPLHVSATMGSSQFNEWYAFPNRDEALRFINETFHSQSFVDQFVEWNGEFYYAEDVTWDGDIPRVEIGTEAELADMVRAESKF